jgi:hypothetical protein
VTKPAHDPRLQVLLSDLQSLERKETFLGLWNQSRALVRPRWMPYVIGEIAIGLLAFISALPPSVSVVRVGERVRDVSDKMFGFAATVLGIVIAGFAIFATISQSNIVVALAVRRKDDAVLPLRRIALHFAGACVPYVVFVAYYLLLISVGWFGGPVTLVANALEQGVAKALGAGIFGIVVWGAARLLVTLATLVTNIYTSFMLLAGAKIADTEDAVKVDELYVLA